MSGFVVLAIGCAECRGGWETFPLAEVQGFYATEAEARASVGVGADGHGWRDHPAGGWFYATSDGDYWVAPLFTFTPPTHAHDETAAPAREIVSVQRERARICAPNMSDGPGCAHHAHVDGPETVTVTVDGVVALVAHEELAGTYRLPSGTLLLGGTIFDDRPALAALVERERLAAPNAG